MYTSFIKRSIKNQHALMRYCIRIANKTVAFTILRYRESFNAMSPQLFNSNNIF